MDRFFIKLPYFYFLACGLLSVYLAYTENFANGIALLLICFLGVLLLWKKGSIQASLLFLIIVFPLNIALTLPSFVDNAYVGGVFINYLAPTLYIQDLAVVLLILAFLPFLKVKSISKNVKYLLILIFFFWFVHNLYFHEIIVFFTTSRLLVYLFTVLLLYETKDIFIKNLVEVKSMLLSILVIVLLFQLFIAINQISGGVDLGLSFIGESDVAAGLVNASSIDINGALYLRGYGTFPHPNLLGGFSALVFTISSIFFFLKKEISVTQYVVIAGLSVVLAFCSFSQGAWIVIILNSILIFSSTLYKNYSRNSSMNGFIALPLFLSLEDRSVRERLSLSSSTFDYIKENLLFGVGGGNFVKEFYPYAPENDNKLSILQPVHNIFLLFLAEYGVFLGGVIAVGTILFYLIRIVQTRYKVAVLSLFIFVFLIGMVDHYLITLPQGLLMFLFSAFVVSLL